MSKPYYATKYPEVSKDVVNAVYEAVRVAKQSGKVRKGTNETTKAIERGISKLVVIAEDVEPPEVVAHLPILCEERNAAFIFVPSKQQLGASLGTMLLARLRNATVRKVFLPVVIYLALAMILRGLGVRVR